MFYKLIFSIFLLSTLSCAAQSRRVTTLFEKDGKIGIGTPVPDEKLTVKGKIHTQEVLVDLEGAVAPDYVFQQYFQGNSVLRPEYQMPSLVDLEKYVKEHHHLPGIPSAMVLATEGLSLKEMNLKLLEKIEELTIYTLEQQKQIDSLKKQIENLSNSRQ